MSRPSSSLVCFLSVFLKSSLFYLILSFVYCLPHPPIPSIHSQQPSLSDRTQSAPTLSSEDGKQSSFRNAVFLSNTRIWTVFRRHRAFRRWTVFRRCTVSSKLTVFFRRAPQKMLRTHSSLSSSSQNKCTVYHCCFVIHTLFIHQFQNICSFVFLISVKTRSILSCSLGIQISFVTGHLVLISNTAGILAMSQETTP